MVQSFNSKVKRIAFMVGDIVFHRADLNKGNAGPRKLKCNWERSFKVIKIIRPGALELNGKAILRSWNIANLKKF